MRPTTVTLAAAGQSPAVPVDFEQANFKLGIQIQTTATTIGVEGTCEDPDTATTWVSLDTAAGASLDLTAVASASTPAIANMVTPIRAIRIVQVGAGVSECIIIQGRST